ncbi:MAG: KpsF/GutQ family sugar-phosphate isomerase [Granulosicoccaceae bacterium]|jgi:arabinose-5-phosphate isomerase
MIDDTFLRMGRAVIEAESRAVADLLPRIDAEFVKACRLMLDCRGRIIVIGMGKSGHIGNKIASTLASTGTPAFFVHPGEAAHGDFGMITADDVIIAASNSGETDEIVMLLPLLTRLGVPLIALCGKRHSSLGQAASAYIDISVEQEACPLNLAPTSSTTVTLVLGDALAIALLEARGFTEQDFARSHPAGRLGRRLLLHIDDIMHKGDAIPSVRDDALLRDALVEMTRKGLGMTAIVDANNTLVGIYTDGDLRRTLDMGTDVHDAKISELMTREFVTVKGGILAEEALLTMQEKKINGLLVVDDNRQLLGALNMHDLLRAGVV